MQIKISYEPTAQELATASSLFIEKKPFMIISIGFLNAFAYFILIIIVLKGILVKHILPNELLAGVGACVWLFGRRPFNEWLLLQRMKRSLLLNSTITVDVSLNGIAWSGKRVVTASLKWNEFSYMIETKNGFILPIGGSQFLWLPFRGFSSPSDIDSFKQSIQEHKIKIR
jgi:hypothetical protein